MDYSKGKIYKIKIGDFYYYGSTVSSLNRRLYGHKKRMEKIPDIRLYVKIQEVGWDNVIIELVENYPCNSLSELLQRETTYINLSDPFCLNMRLSFLSADESKKRKYESAKQWKDKNKERISKKGKEYKESHPPNEEMKQKIREYQREYMRKLRSSLPKKEKKRRTDEEIAESKRKKKERDTKALKEASDEVKEMRRLRHNELQKLRRASAKAIIQNQEK